MRMFGGRNTWPILLGILTFSVHNFCLLDEVFSSSLIHKDISTLWNILPITILLPTSYS